MKSKLHTHLRENNKESQSHLEKNAAKFSQQCLKIILLMYRGIKFTTVNAPSHAILSLPRRIKDLRDRNGIKVNEKWLLDHKGGKTMKVWFIDMRTRRRTRKEVIDSWKKRFKQLNK